MQLPGNVQYCIETLERASFATYAVGGCVRDSLLGLTPQDYDLCTAALPQQIQDAFPSHGKVLSGLKHGTVGIIFSDGVVEITTFRTEEGYTDGRHPDRVHFVSSIEEDLSRRDFTVNAMAYSPTRGIVDPFCGRHDLGNKILRAVGDPAIRFQEDALRILRGVRFAIRYNLTPDSDTEQAMTHLAPLMDQLARERVFSELCKLLPLATARDLIRFAPILTQPIPELAEMVGFDQHSPHHAYDLYTHTAHVTEGVSPDLTLRWAALLHDVGKIPCFTQDETGRGHFYGHAQAGAPIADQILRRLKAPTALREQVVNLVGLHMTLLEPIRKTLRRRLSRLGRETVDQLLQLQMADMGSKGTGNDHELVPFHQVRNLLAELYEEAACLTVGDLEVTGNDLIKLGFTPGKALGDCLMKLLDQVVDETLPNEKTALLQAAKAELPQ